MPTLTMSVDFYIQQCCTCGVSFGVTNRFDSERRKDKAMFYCPNGHSQSYRESEADWVRRERDRAIQDQARLNDELSAARRRIEQEMDARQKAEREAKRIKKRAAAALCPCCNRHFTQLDRHIKQKHPDLAPKPDHKIVQLRSDKASGSLGA